MTSPGKVCPLEQKSNLFEEVAELTGLPQHLIRDELRNICKNAGVNPETLTLDQLKGAMNTYLKQVIVETYGESTKN